MNDKIKTLKKMEKAILDGCPGSIVAVILMHGFLWRDTKEGGLFWGRLRNTLAYNLTDKTLNSS